MESWRVSVKLRTLTDLEMELARKKLELYIEWMVGGTLNKEATYYVGNLVRIWCEDINNHKKFIFQSLRVGLPRSLLRGHSLDNKNYIM